MSVDNRGSGGPGLQRVAVGLLAGVSAVGALWVTGLAMFVVGMNWEPGCPIRSGPGGPLVDGALTAAWAAAAGACWLIVAGLASFAVRRRGIRGRRWLLVPAAFVALASVYLAVGLAMEPGGPAKPGTCQGIQLH